MKMEKFNYTVSIEAPGKEVADNLMIYFFRKDSIPLADVMKEMKTESKEEKKETKIQGQEEEKENKTSYGKVLSILDEVESIIEIIRELALTQDFFERIQKSLEKNPLKKAA